MITAEEYLASKGLKGVGNLLVRDNSNYSENGTQKLMIEFAKLHVEAALKAKIEAMRETYTYGGYSLDELNAFTKNAYPESNIK